MRVVALIERVQLERDYGMVEGVEATCERCNHCTESFGTSDASVRRCLALLNEECPELENNFYIPDDEDDESGSETGLLAHWPST